MEQKGTRNAKEDCRNAEEDRLTIRAAFCSAVWGAILSIPLPRVVAGPSIVVNSKLLVSLLLLMGGSAAFGMVIGAFFFREFLTRRKRMIKLAVPCAAVVASLASFGTLFQSWTLAAYLGWHDPVINRLFNVVALAINVGVLSVCLGWYYRATHGGRPLLNFSRPAD